MTSEQVARESWGREQGTPSERLEQQERRRVGFLRLVEHPTLTPQTTLEALCVADQPIDADLHGEVSTVASTYGVTFETLDPEEQEYLLLLYRNSKEATRDTSKAESAMVIDENLRRHLFDGALRRIDDLRIAMTEAGSFDEMKTRLLGIMDQFAVLAKKASPEQEENHEMWMRLFERFRSLVSLKKTLNPTLQKVFSEVFDAYHDLIDDEFVYWESERLQKAQKPHDLEYLSHEIYGRSATEMRELKRRNHVKVIEYLAENKDEPPSLELIQQIYQTYNQGIIPKKFSRFRERGEQVSFGKRQGIFGGDVREEMEDFEARARLLTLERMPKALYEITVAKLYNDFLDIHPFQDRNAVTALFFSEFLMQKRGHTPTLPAKEKDPAYTRKAFGYNPVALILKAKALKRCATEPGYYEKGKTTKGKEEKYQFMLNRLLERQKRMKPQKKIR